MLFDGTIIYLDGTEEELKNIRFGHGIPYVLTIFKGEPLYKKFYSEIIHIPYSSIKKINVTLTELSEEDKKNEDIREELEEKNKKLMERYNTGTPTM